MSEKDSRSSDEIQSGGSKTGSGEPWAGLNSSSGKPSERNRRDREAWVGSSLREHSWGWPQSAFVTLSSKEHSHYDLHLSRNP